MEQIPTPSNSSFIRRFVFTLNNWREEELTALKSFPCAWMVLGKETGDNGTPHIQGACVLGKQIRFTTLKSLPGFRRAHIERMNGSPQDSLRYCSKQDLNPFVKGSLPAPGKRNDLKEVVDQILGGATLQDVAEDPEMGAVAVVKFHKGLTILRSLTRPNRSGFPTTFWLFGPTGSGKTKCSFLSGSALAPKGENDIWISSGGLRWFDGYDGQYVAIFDDFRAKQCTSFAYFLRLLDRYPVSCEFKGGHVKFNPSIIFITCPYDPDECFSTRKQHVPEDIDQLKRRITESGGAIIELKDGLTSAGHDAVCATIRARVLGDTGGDRSMDDSMGE